MGGSTECNIFRHDVRCEQDGGEAEVVMCHPAKSQRLENVVVGIDFGGDFDACYFREGTFVTDACGAHSVVVRTEHGILVVRFTFAVRATHILPCFSVRASVHTIARYIIDRRPRDVYGVALDLGFHPSRCHVNVVTHLETVDAAGVERIPYVCAVNFAAGI